MTIGDKNFFSIIHFSIKQVLKFYPTAKLFIYDWGFTPFQKKKINTYPNTILIDWIDKLDRENWQKKIRKTYNKHIPLRVGESKKEYILNQKPICMLDCAKRIKENLIFFDGDVILINPIDEIFEDNYDIGLTVSEKLLIHLQNNNWIWGVNSGVIFFKLGAKYMQLFIQEWINEIKTSNVSILMEQAALFNLIIKRNRKILYKEYNIGIIKLANLEYRIKTFPISIYNYACIGEWYNDKKVKLLHLILLKYAKLYTSKNLTDSIIIRDYIREIKIRYAFFHILKLVSPILSLKIKENIKDILTSFLIFKLFKLLVKPLNFNLIKLIIYSVILNIKKKKKKQES